uniref:Uncharacterized protein n=1 Tax=Anguilla anguilla TaxID=7936 RepID=A0A0E9ULJ6_ANGAN
MSWCRPHFPVTAMQSYPSKSSLMLITT